MAKGDLGIVVVALLGALFAGGCESPNPAATSPAVTDQPDVPALALQAAAPPGLAGTLIFHSDREGRHKLFALDLATTVVTRLTTGVDHHDEDAASSPDGTQLAFTSTRFDARTWHIAVADASAGQVRQVTTHLAFDRHVTWMPDGRSLLFSSEQEGTQAVFRIWLDSGRTARVSPAPQRALMPTASPDGTQVAYTMGTAEGFRLAVQDLATSAVRLVTPPEANAVDARWSPDGRRLAYVRMLPTRSFIEIINLDTGMTTAIAVEGMVVLREPGWSADGQWLVAAASARTGDGEDWDLVLLQPDPPGAFRLTGGRANDRAPEWIPR